MCTFKVYRVNSAVQRSSNDEKIHFLKTIKYNDIQAN